MGDILSKRTPPVHVRTTSEDSIDRDLLQPGEKKKKKKKDDLCDLFFLSRLEDYPEMIRIRVG